MDNIKKISFENSNQPSSNFDLIRLEDVLNKDLNHDVTQIHKIEFYHILLITSGTGYHTIDFTNYKYKKRSLITIRQGQLQKFFRSPNAQGILLLFTEDFLVSHFSKLEVSKSIQLFNELLTMPLIDLSSEDYDDLMKLVERIEEEYYKNYDEFSVGIIRSALHMFIIKLYRIKTKKSHIFTNRKYVPEFMHFQKLIEEHCFETKKVSDYAQRMNCSTKTLNNITKGILGKSAKIVIDELVMTQIKRLLLNTSLTIKEIAYTAGFEDPTNLYKYFKKYAQTSPEAFRKAHS